MAAARPNASPTSRHSAATVFAIAWPLRTRLERRPLALMWLVIGLLAIGRFLEFFLRSDSADLALGLEIAQWTSLALLAATAAGAWLTLGPARNRLAPPGTAEAEPAPFAAEEGHTETPMSGHTPARP